MGCGHSREENKAKSVASTNQPKRSQQPKAPVLLFYLPSNVRDLLTRLIASHLITSETATQADRLNIRFVDVPNQRSYRRFWPREFTNKQDYAAALYIADIRDRANLLMNARTLNWFLKLVLDKYNLIVVAICSNEVQLNEFQSMLCAQIEPLVLSETNPETVLNFVEIITTAVSRYNDTKKRTADVTMRGK
ncbi:hypothetical protein TRFO_05586 [Tritrichomonas foetus]|uniref:Uncharacterized protein n=1 Tax=Tritrichomonas foetus TaxID=1144522 RepID=A0A1J4K9K8_9EUKA|nr:hypothetical protein TRFO_05586 [Tritrichomonas foetus]|eukprot:OHT06388.1 hypothetical protein TRFO_05586 [Tritrichomonas foetus]